MSSSTGANELPTYDEVIYQKQNEANGQNPTSPQPSSMKEWLII